MNIREITIRRCLEEQYWVAKCHHNARTWLEHLRNGTATTDAARAAIREQLLARYHFEQMASRLDRILGADAIVEQKPLYSDEEYARHNRIFTSI